MNPVCCHCQGSEQCDCSSCGHLGTGATWKAGRCRWCDRKLHEDARRDFEKDHPARARELREEAVFIKTHPAPAALYLLIGKRVYTRRGIGKLLTVFWDRCEVQLDGEEKTVRLNP